MPILFVFENDLRMTTNSNSSNDSDSWEGLAKDLFGIDVGKNESDDEPFEVIDLSSLDPEPEEPVEEESVESEAVAESDDSDAGDEDADIVFEKDDDDEFDIIFEEDDDGEVAPEPEPAPVRASSPQAEPVAETREPRSARKSVPKSDADDSFWDPLDDWNVGGTSGKKTSSRPASESALPSEKNPSSGAKRVDSADEDDGVEESVPAAKKQVTGERPKKRRPPRKSEPAPPQDDDSFEFGVGVLDDEEENFFEP